jgi:RNA polymerase sigma-70 factor (ECF subfamily)
VSATSPDPARHDRPPEASRAPGSNPLPPTESLLLQRFRAGEAGAFELLLRPQVPALLGLARRLAGPHWAEDLLQEVLIRAFRGLAAFRGESSLKTWLFRISYLLASEPSRWKRQERAAEPIADEIPDHVSDTAEQLASQRELRDRLAEAMERLSLKQRTALHLRASEGLDYKSIASCMHTSEEAARRLVLLARRNLLARLGPHLQP